MEKNYTVWSKLKSDIHNKAKRVWFKERDILWISIGENVGFEEDGKNKLYSRPVLVMRKFNNFLFWGIPLSTTKNRGKYYYAFQVNDKISVALISQIRAFDSSRITGSKMGMISEYDFEQIKEKLSELLHG